MELKMDTMRSSFKTCFTALAPSNILASSAFAGELIIKTDTSNSAPKAAFKAAFEALIATFETANPDISVTWNRFDHEGYKSSIGNFSIAETPDLPDLLLHPVHAQLY